MSLSHALDTREIEPHRKLSGIPVEKENGRRNYLQGQRDGASTTSRPLYSCPINISVTVHQLFSFFGFMSPIPIYDHHLDSSSQLQTRAVPSSIREAHVLAFSIPDFGVEERASLVPHRDHMVINTRFRFCKQIERIHARQCSKLLETIVL